MENIQEGEKEEKEEKENLAKHEKNVEENLEDAPDNLLQYPYAFVLIILA